MIATRPLDRRAWEICRVYVHPDAQGTGLAQILLQTAERHAIQAGATSIVLWTDSRFLRAHRFYQKHGYVSTGETRELHDLARTTEYRYAKST